MQPFPKGLDFSEIPNPGKKLTGREKENTLEENA
jgi:hypothetical protein